MKLYWEDKISKSKGIGLDSLLKYKQEFLCAIEKSEQEIDSFIILKWK